MPRLAERAAGTLGHLAPKAAGLLSVTGFAAAGVVSVVAENLRTLADRDEALPDRAKQVAQNSIGAVLAGPGALSQRGRELVGRAGDDGAGTNGRVGDRDRGPLRPSAKTTAKTVAPDERPDRSKAEEARDRDADTDEVATARGKRDTAMGGTKTPPRAIDTSSAEAAPGAAKPASRDQDEQAGATKGEADARKEQARTAAAKAERSATKKPAAKKSSTKKSTAKKSSAKKSSAKKSTAKGSAAETDTPETGTADPTRSVEEQRAAQKTARKQAADRQGPEGGQDAPASPDGVPEDVDEQLVADLQRMTVKQLRDRAAADGVPGRSGMNKDELVVALATRETDDVPAKA